METVIFVLGALFGGVWLGAIWLGAKLKSKAADPVLAETLKAQAFDRASYLNVLRRELANILIWRDSRRYLNLYQELRLETESIKLWQQEEIHKRLLEFYEKYPHFSDFDAIQTREYVLYADGWKDHEELESAYRDIVKFVALSCAGNPAWKEASVQGFAHQFSSQEQEHLSNYVQQIEDTRLQLRIEQAMRAYFGRRDVDKFFLENDFYSIRVINHLSPDNRYGIHLKRTNEFAIYSIFIYDSGRESISFYRSDSTFKKEEYVLRASSGLLEEFKRYLSESAL
jgi:hypothetical protein